MTRVTRSRQAASAVGANVKIALKRTATGAVTKKSVGKTRSTVKKVSSQDENAIPIIQVSKGKGSKSKGSVLGINKDEPLPSTVLGLKSPALRDRTNTTNELITVDTISKFPDNIPLNKNKKTNVKRTTGNRKKQSGLTNTLAVSIEKYTVKLSRAQKDHNRNNLLKNEDLSHSKKAIDEVSEKKDINENFDNSQEPSPSGKSKSDTPAKKAIKRKNISLEDVEKLLNEDDDEDIEGHETSDDEQAENVQEENAKINDIKTKKFFKYKNIEAETKLVVPSKKNPVQNKKSRAAKKAKNNDSTFSPKMEGPRQSSKPESKQLRTRVPKNYYETSRLSNQQDESKKDTKSPVESDLKGVPIYKTIKLSQEEKKESDQIYEFDASQDDGQKGKKRKKTVKRPAVKRAKKVANLPFAPLAKKKPVKAVNKNVQSKADNVNKANADAVSSQKKVDNTINTNSNPIVDNIGTDFMVSDNPPQIDDSAFQEAPTIKIVSDKKLEGSHKFRLTTTPPAPKTAVSGLKVFAPKSNTAPQTNQQLKKMANHSLIRESMSPITKVNDEFDTGSPWRAPVIDTFTRVRRLVQSTPQVKKQALQFDKRPLEHVAELNKKSFGSEETIHLSTVTNNKPSKECSLAEMSTLKQDEPRKFGTVISNLSPSKSTLGSSSNSSTQKSPAQGTSLQSIAANNHQVRVKAISPPSTDLSFPVNYKKLDNEDPTINFDNKENISPKNTPTKKKILAPSPFRFEKIRSSKRLAATSSTTKSPEKASPPKSQETDPEAGPSWLDKPKSTTMKQTNLNNFLNLVDMPKSANISTPHGIFNDVCSTPVSGKKPRKFVEEANVENAFGFDDFDCDGTESIENVSSVKIATEADVKNSVKGKLFPKARVKSSVPSRISENTVKRALLKNVLKKKVVEKAPEFVQEEQEEVKSDSSENYNENVHVQVAQYKESEKVKKKTMLDAISFSDTFDVLSENGEELQAKVPEEIPLFVDLEPAHFTKPPRKSYNKRKRNVCFDVDNYDSSDGEDEPKKKKAKKKKHKEPHLSKEEKRRMENWVKNVNRTFDEIEHFDLVVEVYSEKDITRHELHKLYESAKK